MARKPKYSKLKEQALEYLQTAIQSNGELVDNHEDGLKNYLREPYGNEIEGRSQVVMSDVADTIEWVMPALMKIFYGGSKVVELRAQGAEDEDKAKLMEEKVNFDFMRGINGYTLMHDWLKGAMLGKFSVVKYWWEDGEDSKKKEFEGLTEDELAALAQDESLRFEEEDIEEIEISPGSYDMFSGVTTPPVMAYSVSARKITKYSKPMAVALPPEEFVFDLRTSGSLADAEFCAHKKRVHRNHLKRYKIKPSEIDDELAYFSEHGNIKETRFNDLGGIQFVTDDKEKDFVYLYECYMNDYDGDGNKIPMKVVIFGSRVLSVEENTYGKPPFCGITTIRIPHRAAGLSLADLVKDLQKLKTALMRAILDNLYYQNNGITVVNPYRINMDDVIDRNEPGAKWRTRYDVDPNSVFAPVPVQPMAQQAFGLLETVDSIKEKRTGVTSYNQGLDSKSLNKTATGISQIMGAAQQRMELIARMFAETGVAELFQAFVDMNLQFFDGEASIRLNEGWQTITPEQIDGKFDITIDVGVGTGSNEVKIGQLMNMINVSGPATQMGIVSPEQFGNLLSSIYELMGWKNTQKFVGGQQAGPDPQMQQLHAQYEEEIQKLKQQLDMVTVDLRNQEEKNATDAKKAEDIAVNNERKLILDAEKIRGELALKARELEIKACDVAAKSRGLDGKGKTTE